MSIDRIQTNSLAPCPSCRWRIGSAGVYPDAGTKRLRAAHDAEPAKSGVGSLPVQITALGRFQIKLDGTALEFSGKAPKKPLQLLKALIAFGGRDVRSEEIMSALWPGLGRSARASFDIALMRLRKILGRPELLILEDGLLTLNGSLGAVDVWTFESAVDRLDLATSETRGIALELYRGCFLEGEGAACWIVNARDRLSSKFRRAVIKVAHREESEQRWESAIEWYRLALERDNLFEEFHSRLMRAEWRLGKRADAIRTYRRCRELLSINLQTEPSKELQSLYQHVLSHRYEPVAARSFHRNERSERAVLESSAQARV